MEEQFPLHPAAAGQPVFYQLQQQGVALGRRLDYSGQRVGFSGVEAAALVLLNVDNGGRDDRVLLQISKSGEVVGFAIDESLRRSAVVSQPVGDATLKIGPGDGVVIDGTTLRVASALSAHKVAKQQTSIDRLQHGSMSQWHLTDLGPDNPMTRAFRDVERAIALERQAQAQTRPAPVSDPRQHSKVTAATFISQGRQAGSARGHIYEAGSPPVPLSGAAGPAPGIVFFQAGPDVLRLELGAAPRLASAEESKRNGRISWVAVRPDQLGTLQNGRTFSFGGGQSTGTVTGLVTMDSMSADPTFRQSALLQHGPAAPADNPYYEYHAAVRGLPDPTEAAKQQPRRERERQRVAPPVAPEEKRDAARSESREPARPARPAPPAPPAQPVRERRRSRGRER